MVSYQRPGVYVEEQLRTRNPAPAPSNSAAVFISSHGQGPLEPHLVRSWSDFNRVYGGFPSRSSMLPYAVFQYFNNGGREAYVLRVTGATPVVSTATLSDAATTPAPTLQVDAVNPGAWGDEIYIGIAYVGDTDFELTVYLGGTSSMNIVEKFTDLTMDPNSGRYVESRVNSILSGSSYITVSDADSTNYVDDYGIVRPAETGATPEQLAGGDDGAAPTATDLTDALDQLEVIDRTYDLNYPGVYDSVVINAALQHVEDRGTGFVIIDTPPDSDLAALATWAADLSVSSYGAVYYPYIHIGDPGANTQGATKLVPPGGAVAGIYAHTDASRGTWKAPAGLTTRVSGAVSTERRLTNDDLETLNSSHINAIRHAPGAGFVVWGARTLKLSQADKYVPIRRHLNWLRQTLNKSTEWAVFEPNDEVLWSTLESSIGSFLNGVWQRGGLRGESPEEAFYVKSDADLNTTSTIEAGIVNVEIGVALQYPAEFVVIKLSQWEGGSAVTEVA